MKRRAACLMACLLMCLVPLAALAAVSATPNQLLFFRTGPTVDYAPLCEMSERTALTAIEYESGSGVTWVLVEFMRNGMPERGYTGLKRMTVHGDIPWADHWNVPATLQQAAAVYAGPGYEYTPHGNLASGSGVTLLRQEGDFSFIDYIDRDGYPSRGWVESYALSSGSSYGQPSQPYGQVITYSGGTLVRVRQSGGAAMYAQPSSSARLYTVPYGTVLESYSTTSNGYIYVMYQGTEGYIPTSALELY